MLTEFDQSTLDHYESLRSHALRKELLCSKSIGMAIFLQKGMYSWIKTCFNHDYPSESLVIKKHNPLPMSTREELVLLITNLVLSIKEVWR